VGEDAKCSGGTGMGPNWRGKVKKIVRLNKRPEEITAMRGKGLYIDGAPKQKRGHVVECVWRAGTSLTQTSKEVMEKTRRAVNKGGT